MIVLNNEQKIRLESEAQCIQDIKEASFNPDEEVFYCRFSDGTFGGIQLTVKQVDFVFNGIKLERSSL